jgi:hypothetical protein
MTLYARSDLAAVAVSRDHKGCGEVHRRPVVAGAPAKVWALNCHPCEDFLRSDSLWTTQITTIPETIDETSAREDIEKRGSIEQAQSTADALGQLAKLGDLPAILGQFMQFMTTGNIGPAAPVGAPQADIVATPEVSRAPQLPPVVQPVEKAAPVEPVELAKPDLDTLTINELREIAKQNGVPITRSRDDQIAALKAALG